MKTRSARYALWMILMASCCSHLAVAQMPTPKPKLIISQWIEHPALDASWKGIQDELQAAGFTKGQNIEWIYHNAQGNMNANMLIAKHIATSKPKPDLAIAISTPSAQCLLQAVGSRVPMVFSAVSDAKAAGLVKNLDHPEGMMTGVTDLPPIKDQLPVYKKVLPHLKKLGIIYNSGEVNSVEQLNKLVRVCGHEVEVVKRCVSDAKEIQSATKSLLGEVDALYIPLDNTVLSSAGMIIKLAHKAEKPIPVIGGSLGIVEQGALLSVGYDHYQLGRETGKVVLRLLKGESPSAIPVRAMPKTQVFLNTTTAHLLNISIPKPIFERAQKFK